MTTTPEAAGTRASDGNAGGGPGDLRGLLPRGLIVLLGAAAVVVVAAGLRSMAWLVGPAFLALVIVVTLAPVQTRLRRRGWPGWAVTLALLVVVYAVVLGLSLSIVVSIARLATTLPQYAASSKDLATSLTSTLAKFGVGPEQLKQVVQGLDLGKLASLIGALLADVAGLAGNLVFILVLLLFLSVETSGMGSRIAIIAADRPAAVDALRSFAWGTRQYMIVSTVFGLIVAALDTIGLALLGVPLAVTWGILAFVTNYIPNIGFILGLVPPALLGLLVGGPQKMVLVIVVYCALNFVIQSLIQPRYVGDSVGLSITITFVSLVFWTWLVGPLGAILAIPLTLLAKAVLVDIDPQARWADAFLRSVGKDPEPSDTLGSFPGPVAGRPVTDMLHDGVVEQDDGPVQDDGPIQDDGPAQESGSQDAVEAAPPGHRRRRWRRSHEKPGVS